MKKTTLIMIGLCLIIIACSKKSDDSSSTNNVTPPSCSDGIQNQGETGIDCGGPCPACSAVLCNGNGTNQYYPLHYNNYWYYDLSGATFNIDRFLKDSTTSNGNKYYSITDFIAGTSNMYGGTVTIRYDVTGEIIALDGSTEYSYLPANPFVGQSWSYPVFNGGTREVTNLNGTLTTSSCTYTGCLVIEEHSGSGTLWETFYYKKGIGIVYSSDGTTSYKLEDITLN